MIKACVIYYNDGPWLTALLPTIIGEVDDVIAVDGLIKHFPLAEVLSTDGSTEIIESFGGRVIQRGLWESEIHKRQTYIENAKNGDMLFIIDCDEVLQGVLPDDHHPYTMSLYHFHTQLESQPRLRLIPKSVNLKYIYNHWTLVDQYRDYTQEANLGHMTHWKEGSIYHLHFLRSNRRKYAKWIYNVSRQDPVQLRTS